MELVHLYEAMFEYKMQQSDLFTLYIFILLNHSALLQPLVLIPSLKMLNLLMLLQQIFVLPPFKIDLGLFLQFVKIFGDLEIQKFYISSFLLKINLKESIGKLV